MPSFEWPHLCLLVMRRLKDSTVQYMSQDFQPIILIVSQGTRGRHVSR